ncbi:MAG: hypothetical protein A2487_20360 [Candidatus Raymondbacteria bacterium RifOxyC12_full_50_8]|uniref:TldD/PmbA family protein n=1 Tax=Candidatus Raymondbacteria bacterium RIFOXYD12_FULL_49_13 TaxID=1817890 RepID=A0A1F7FAF1_UNCRA|nr:MAG: hypothetical protein A2248_22325 [Candidatus Raymondbacteria bacterium RIFOXYA2_FULL_49_16]OGJ94010.1 MAG: hypothetical protein A2350_19595 [Candidatus Raymondbacteria bacterium RifOxyB12_full_50_8]OGJ96430.1 MAG: hypothetical protein A2487_20360 [Candidatus Raymondbacteria bacterium RifOxyC12_full_50_8]OGK03502.1 MAG: hypothetical protein A2519_09720 [Candidatus Raymondbacteria bacterium RIFOXYD12_FULL_49_13]OGP42825.1 MAG: hypothetical protein A2324_16080 [Candidatus Raymondbacteria b
MTPSNIPDFFDPQQVFSLLKGKTESAELVQSESANRPVVFKSNALKSVETNYSFGAGLRIIASGRLGFAVSTDPAKVQSLVDRALESARFGEKAAFDLPGSCTPAAAPALIDTAVSALTLEDKDKLGKEAIAALLAGDSGVHIDCEIGTASGRMVLDNSRGLHLEAQTTMFDFSYSILHVDANGLLWLYDGNMSHRLDIRMPAQVARTLLLLKKAKQVVATGAPETVICEPSVVGTLASSFLAGLNGKTVLKGASPLGGRLGHKIIDDRISLAEEPFLDYRPGSAGFDGEGLAKQRNVLIDKGVATMYFYDLQTAGLVKAQPTANGSRGATSLPSPGCGNLVIPPGTKNTEQIIRETKNGLWVHSVLGSGQSNMLAGDFSLNTHLAYRIENGEITGRVKDTMMSGNVYDVFNKIGEISSTVDDSGSSIFPAISFQGITVNG